MDTRGEWLLINGIISDLEEAIQGIHILTKIKQNSTVESQLRDLRNMVDFWDRVLAEEFEEEE